MSNDETTNCGYMLLFRGTDWNQGLSPDEMQTVAEQFMAWFDRLTREGKVTSGHPLTNGGKVVSGRNGRTVADGPFAESKEAVGGYFLLQVESMDEAVAIAKECPALPHGLMVEVREVAEVCPYLECSNQRLAQIAG